MPAVPFDYLVSALVTLFVVVEPIGIAPVFLAVTQQLPPQERRRVAVGACLIAAAILAGSATIGDWLLAVLGILLPAFRSLCLLEVEWIGASCAVEPGGFSILFGLRHHRKLDLLLHHLWTAARIAKAEQ